MAGSRSASGSNVAGSKSFWPVAMTRRPLRAEALVLGEVAVADLRDRDLGAVRAVGAVGAREELVRRALDVAADDVLARSSSFIAWKVAIIL